MVSLMDREKTFLHVLFLSGLQPLAGERTLQSLFYILKGRKANQTYQDVHMYQLQGYYRLMPALSREQWEESIATMQAERLIEPLRLGTGGSKTTFRLTEAGAEKLRRGQSQYDLPGLLSPFGQDSGLTARIGNFWMRLHLMVQTLSHLLDRQPSFYPIVQHRPTQQWVKQQLGKPEKRAQWMTNLYEELYETLAGLPEEQQFLLVSQLSGARKQALTTEQLAYQLGEAPSLVVLKWKHGLARLILTAERAEPGQYPLLRQMFADEREKHDPLSESARETYELLQRNLDIGEIASRRQLKASTVEDHLVEIALCRPEWDCSRYLTEADRIRILQTSHSLGTRRLRLIKDALGESFSFLQIRLALAREGGWHDHGT